MDGFLSKGSPDPFVKSQWSGNRCQIDGLTLFRSGTIKFQNNHANCCSLEHCNKRHSARMSKMIAGIHDFAVAKSQEIKRTLLQIGKATFAPND